VFGVGVDPVPALVERLDRPPKPLGVSEDVLAPLTRPLDVGPPLGHLGPPALPGLPEQVGEPQSLDPASTGPYRIGHRSLGTLHGVGRRDHKTLDSLQRLVGGRGPRLGPAPLLGLGHDLLHAPGCRRQHQQRRHVGVALLPDARGRPAQAQRELPAKARDAHRPPVDLHHGVVLGLTLPDQHERIGHDRRLTFTDLELLAGFHLPGEGEKLPPERRREAHKGHVQPGDRGRVAKEGLLGVLPLPAPGKLPSTVERVGKARGPPVIGRRPLICVRLPAAAQPELPEAIEPVAGGPLRDLQHGADLLRRRHAMLAQHGHDLPVRRRQLIERDSSADSTDLPCPLTILTPPRRFEGLRGGTKQS
jgi:hypothetical protein